MRPVAFWIFYICVVALFLIGLVVEFGDKCDGTIRTHHRITPRMELIIDSGRVDTAFIYKAEGK
jgi:hypothetical protein